MRLRILLIMLTGIMIPLTVFSQEEGSCAEKLKTAQGLFDKGQVELVPSLLNECLKSGFSREESLTAYKLIIQSYLFEDKLSKADSSMLAFLKKNPEYKVSATDHSSFVHLYNSFFLKKVVQISLHMGTNLPFVSVIKHNSTAAVAGKYHYSSNALNLAVSLETKIKLTERTELNAEVGYSKLSFLYTSKDFEFGEISYNENQMRFEVPVSITYDISSFGRFTPYIRAGIGPSIMMSANAQASFSNYEDSRDDRPARDFIMKDARISMDLFGQLGGGIKAKTRDGFLFAEVRAHFGVFNQHTSGFVDPDLENFYFYKGDDFRINNLNFNIGYTRIFYKPLKRVE